MNVEETRAVYRPERIRTLFVGESAPVSGDFFYFGNTNMTRYMQQAIEAVFGAQADFLSQFKSFGWYLDDLCLTPVNHLKGAARRTACTDAIASLAVRIADYRPDAVVSLLRSIDANVEAATRAAGCPASVRRVAFPGMGQQSRFHRDMLELLPNLPRTNNEARI